MLNVRGTSGAALKLLLPACDAVIVQLPVPVIVTVLPDTVQLPEAEKLTGNPDEAVALTVKGGSLVVLSASGLNVIVWLAFAIVNVCGTEAAAVKLASPAWDAVIVQDPAAVIVTVVAAIVQLPLALKLTVSPDDAVAPTVKFASP